MRSNRTKMQGFMRRTAPDIETIQQPVQGLAIDNHRLAADIARPFEALLLKPLVPEAKAVLLPVQNLDLVARAVDKNIQCWCEGIQPQGRLHQRRQAIDRLPKIHWLCAKIDLGDITCRAYHACDASVPSSCASQPVSGSDSNRRVTAPAVSTSAACS